MTRWRAISTGLALSSALLFPALAHADGMPERAYYTAPFSWTGFYIGGDVGWGWAKSDGMDSNFARNPGTGPLHDFDMDGVIGGGHVGFNYQVNYLVLGVESDWQVAKISGNGGPTLAAGFPYVVSTDVTNYGSLRGRLGFAADSWLVFATGGGVWSRWRADTAFVGAPPFFTNSHDGSGGWTAGGGIERAITNNWLARVEYRHTDLGTFENGSNLANAFSRDHVAVDDVRFGFSYKFGDPGPAYEPLK